MTFCRATRTYFKASEGIEAINQDGEKHLYSPYASFFYCIECGERLITEQEEITEHCPEQLKVLKRIKLRIIEAKKIRERVNQILKELVKNGFLTCEGTLGYGTKQRIAEQIKHDDLIMYSNKEDIITIMSLSDEEFSNYIKDLRYQARKTYFQRYEQRIDSNGQEVCKNCKEKYTKCYDCGEWHKKEEVFSIEVKTEGCIDVCEDCFRDHYVKCFNCSTYINTEYCNYEEIDGEIYCIECAELNFNRCSHCQEWITNDETYETSDGNDYCEYCYNEYTSDCRLCGRRYGTEDMEWDDNEDGYICNDCAEDGCSGIHNYSYKPHPKKHGKDKELIGMEIEVEGRQSRAKQFLEEFGDTQEDDIYLKRDGSVAGFEIVTHPMSRKYFYREFVPKLSKGMAYLRKEGFKGHNKAGIHIHVSTEAINEDMLKKMMILMYSKQKSTYKLWLKITQRKDDNMSRWSSMSPDCLKGTKKDVAKLLDRNKVAGYRTKPPIAHGRYTAINCNNENTIEFRIFNSNIRTERIIKNAQVVFSLIDFTKTNRLPTMNNYLKFIAKNKDAYKELYEFLIEKEIINPKLNEFMETMNVKSIEGLKKELTSIQNKSKEESLYDINNENDERNEQCA